MAADRIQDSLTQTPRLAKWTIFLAATALVVYLCAVILRPFVNIIAWAIVLTITFNPVHQYFTRRTGRPGLSALMSSVLVIFVFLIPFLSVAGLAISQFIALATSLQQQFTDGTGIAAGDPMARIDAWLTSYLRINTTAVVAWVRQHANELATLAAQFTVSIAASVTGAVVSSVFIVFAMFLLFRDGDRMVARIPDFLPFDRERSEAMLLRIRDVIHGGVYGIVVIAIIQGALTGAMFWALGVPSAALWGMVTVLTSVLPLAGAAVVWGPGVLYLFAIGQWWQAVVLAVWGALVISSVDNFLRPRLVGGKVGLSELVMFFAVLGGLQAFGVLGIVLGPVVFAVAASILQVLSAPER